MAFHFRLFMFFLSLFLVPIFYQSSLFVRGDAALISNVCNQTLEPSFCNTCFESYPRSGQEDLRGLGGTAINCAFTLSLALGPVVDEMVSNATVDACREGYMFCATKFDLMGEHLVNGLLSWGNKDYENSALHSAGAYQDLIACVVHLRDHAGGSYDTCFTKEIIHGFDQLAAYCQVSAGVVNQIH